MAGVDKIVKLIAILLMIAGAVLAFIAFLCFVKTFLFNIDLGNQHKIKPLYRIMFVIGYIIVMVAYLMFAYKYPHQCSMHFRYIEITLLFTVVPMGICYSRLKSKRMKNIWDFAVTIFAVLSVLMCSVWCFV